MAKLTRVIMVDDLDGEEIAGVGRTIKFAHAGNSYEIDLTETNADKLEKALAPFIAAARRVDTKRASGAASEPDLSSIRAWARDQGVKVSERGRISKYVQEAYRAAH